MHELTTFVFQYTASDLTFGVQGMGRIVGVATLLVATAINNAGYLAPAQGSGTHRTGLYGNVERAVGEVFSPQFVSCSGDSLHLGMGCHIV